MILPRKGAVLPTVTVEMSVRKGSVLSVTATEKMAKPGRMLVLAVYIV